MVKAHSGHAAPRTRMAACGAKALYQLLHANLPELSHTACFSKSGGVTLLSPWGLSARKVPSDWSAATRRNTALVCRDLAGFFLFVTRRRPMGRQKVSLLILKGKSPQKIFCGFISYRDQSGDFCTLRCSTARPSRLEKAPSPLQPGRRLRLGQTRRRKILLG